MAEESELAGCLASNPHFSLNKYGKIHCSLTGQDIKHDLQEFKQYVNSHHYRLGLEKEVDITKYAPFLVEHFTNKNYVFCLLTKKKMRRHASTIEKHCKGRRFMVIKMSKFVYFMFSLCAREGEREGFGGDEAEEEVLAAEEDLREES